MGGRGASSGGGGGGGSGTKTDKSKIFYEASGNTYAVKEQLKDAGFEWNPHRKTWEGDGNALDEFNRITRVGFANSRVAKAVDKITIQKEPGQGKN